MGGTELAIIILGLAIFGSALFAYKAFLLAQVEAKRAEQASERLLHLSLQETRRLQIFAQALAGGRPVQRDLPPSP